MDLDQLAHLESTHLPLLLLERLLRDERASIEHGGVDGFSGWPACNDAAFSASRLISF
jgi:hypothetical protein